MLSKSLRAWSAESNPVDIEEWYANATKADLISGISDMILQTFPGENGLGGSRAEYAWLASKYQISEEDDVKWQFILERSLPDDIIEQEELDPNDESDAELLAFLNDEDRVFDFLLEMHLKYDSRSDVYPGR